MACARPALERLCQESEITAYFVMRSGFDAVCMNNIEGLCSTRTIPLDIGSRRPLGVGAGDLAVLASCSAEEREYIRQATASRLHQYHDLSIDQQQAIAQSRELGYTLIRKRLTWAHGYRHCLPRLAATVVSSTG